MLDSCRSDRGWVVKFYKQSRHKIMTLYLADVRIKPAVKRDLFESYQKLVTGTGAIRPLPTLKYTSGKCSR